MMSSRAKEQLIQTPDGAECLSAQQLRLQAGRVEGKAGQIGLGNHAHRCKRGMPTGQASAYGTCAP